MTVQHGFAVVLALLLLGAAPAHAGWRNLLVTLVGLPPDGYVVGDTITAELTTQWAGAPLPRMAVLVTLHDPTGRERGRWPFRTDHQGRRLVSIPLLVRDRAGLWHLAAALHDPLPDGSGDGDGVTFVVRP